MDNLTKKLQNSLKLTVLTPEDQEKVTKDLKFIDFITQDAISLGYRVVISGGYSVDGNLGRITRPHNDIDIEIYGTEEKPQVVYDLVEKISKHEEYSELKLIDKDRQEFYHSFFAEGNGLGADIYYVQVVSESFAETKVVVKKDGLTTPRHSFNTGMVVLEGVAFEVVSPEDQLADILKKAEKAEVVKPKHQQDIENLKILIG